MFFIFVALILIGVSISMVGKVKTHFFLEGEFKAKRTVYCVPRVGDKVSLSNDELFTVKSLIWPMDEEDYIYERCNVELVEAPLEP